MRIHGASCLWPGLPHLWTRGSWAGLAVAVGFTALGNGLLLATFVFDEWMTGQSLWIGYGTLVAVWLIAGWHGRLVLRRHSAGLVGEPRGEQSQDRKQEQRDRLFREAQQSYLRSDWVATEKVLLQLLKQDARDVESRLMLATLWRHQGRTAESLRQLDRLERLEAAEKWSHEIAAERAAAASTAAPDKTQEGQPATIHLVHPDEITTDELASRPAA